MNLDVETYFDVDKEIGNTDTLALKESGPLTNASI
jgi:hypothetical protein